MSSVNSNKNSEGIVNFDIKASEVRIISEDGQVVGVFPLREAVRMAEEEGMDLVAIATNVNPPVCKIIDYGRYRYMIRKKNQKMKKSQKVVVVKELKLRLVTQPHDYKFKLEKAKSIIEEGNKVKISVRLKGREVAMTDSVKDMFSKIEKDLLGVAKMEVYNDKEQGSVFAIFCSE